MTPASQLRLSMLHQVIVQQNTVRAPLFAKSTGVSGLTSSQFIEEGKDEIITIDSRASTEPYFFKEVEVEISKLKKFGSQNASPGQNQVVDTNIDATEAPHSPPAKFFPDLFSDASEKIFDPASIELFMPIIIKKVVITQKVLNLSSF